MDGFASLALVIRGFRDLYLIGISGDRSQNLGRSLPSFFAQMTSSADSLQLTEVVWELHLAKSASSHLIGSRGRIPTWDTRSFLCGAFKVMSPSSTNLSGGLDGNRKSRPLAELMHSIFILFSLLWARRFRNEAVAQHRLPPSTNSTLVEAHGARWLIQTVRVRRSATTTARRWKFGPRPPSSRPSLAFNHTQNAASRKILLGCSAR